ncbi:MAG: NAD(P)/FAD-dependent oxidoreductase [Hydrogenimonas sp.]|nr:NAD(P)/FAD-dependent oxidoreductase [Hydrogenimonas sp.]
MHHVVIIGGSYGGLRALGVLAGKKDIKVTLVDRHPYHFLQTEGYDLIAGKVPFDSTIIALRSLCAGFGDNIEYLHAVAKDVDFKNKKVIFEDADPLSYDYLIIAAGAVTRFFENIEGLRDYSYGVKSLRGALKLKEYFEQELYRRLENSKDAKSSYSIVIGGAGLSGVEIAAEMQYYFNRYYRSNSLAYGKLKIHLISGSETILKGLHPSVIKASSNRLAELGVVLHTGSHISRVENKVAILENGEKIPFDFMIFTGGIMGAPFVQSLKAEHNKIGQLVVNRFLQIPGHEEVYAIGDAANLRDTASKRVPPTAQTAEQSGVDAAKNILAHIENRQLHVSNLKLQGLAIALGGTYAIIDAGKFRIYGFLAYLGKKAIEKSYKWPLKLKATDGFKRITACHKRAL